MQIMKGQVGDFDPFQCLFFFWLTVVCMSDLEVWFILRGPASRARIPKGGWWETEGGG